MSMSFEGVLHLEDDIRVEVVKINTSAQMYSQRALSRFEPIFIDLAYVDCQSLSTK